jgi:hypothetical protein
MSSNVEHYFLLHISDNPDPIPLPLGLILRESLLNFPLSSHKCSFSVCVHSLYALFIVHLVSVAFYWSFIGYLHS